MDTLTAYHESGHATVGLLLDKSPEDVSIQARETDRSDGHTRFLSEAKAIIRAAGQGNVDFARDRTMAGLIATAAGPAAQCVHMRGRISFLDERTWEIFGGGGDLEAAEAIIGMTREFLYADLNDVIEEAFDLLEQPAVWSAVTRVADDLVRFKTLDYEGVRDAALFGDLIGITPKRTSPRDDELRRAGCSESEIGTGRRVLSREEAEKKIRAKSPVRASRIAWTDREIERR
jgi:hypothetical protein